MNQALTLRSIDILPGPRGLPLGIQIVGRYRADQAALEAAAWTEATLGFKPGLAGG